MAVQGGRPNNRQVVPYLMVSDGRAALDFAGLGGVRVETMAIRKAGERVVVLQHGHGWDPSNATPTGGGALVPGAVGAAAG